MTVPPIFPAAYPFSRNNGRFRKVLYLSVYCFFLSPSISKKTSFLFRRFAQLRQFVLDILMLSLVIFTPSEKGRNCLVYFYQKLFAFKQSVCYNDTNFQKGGVFLATLDDIAQELGISKSTVSKALNDAKDVSKRMKQAVLEKAVELGYSRSARTSDAPRLAVFITNMEYTKPEDFGYEIVVGFRQAAEPAGFHVELIPLDFTLQNQMRYDEYMVLNNYCGGLFLGLSLLDPWIREFETCRTPTVLYDNHISGNPNVTDIGVDNIEGIALACRYLQSLGHKRIGYLSSALQAYVYRQRYEAFSRVMTENGLKADEDVMGSSFQITACLTEHLPRLLENGCTAIICSHDLLANSVMLHCRDLGLRVPEDISIMGFDDIPLCRYTIPPLTTIRQNRPALGKSAFYALSCHLKGVSLSTHLLHAELIRRDSCTVAPANK